MPPRGMVTGKRMKMPLTRIPDPPSCFQPDRDSVLNKESCFLSLRALLPCVLALRRPQMLGANKYGGEEAGESDP